MNKKVDLYTIKLFLFNHFFKNNLQSCIHAALQYYKYFTELKKNIDLDSK